MATETSGDRAAQCSVPNITFSNESTKEPSRSGGPTTPNTPVVLLARPRDPPSSVAQAAIADVAPISLLQRPSSAPTSMISPSSSTSSPSNISAAKQPETANLDVDAALVEALKSSKDRLYVLKLGESMESLIGQGKLYAKVELQPASSYQRLLVHRCADFYHLTQESSPSSVAVIVTSDSRIPSKRIADLVPPEETVLPAFQIMRRVDRSKTASRATSVDGNLTDDGDESNRSQGSGSKKKHMTIEEREAAYHKARSRIFMDFDEKDASTSSTGALSSAASTVSFTGGSTGMSSVDGDGASTAPTESEYSAPVGRGKDSWYPGSFNSNNGRGIQNNGMTLAGTTLRSTAPSFTSPNVAPPPPKGTVHYLPPIPDTNTHSDMTSPHPQQVPPNGVPAGGYPPYPQPAIYPYYVPYFYPMPYPQPVASQSPPSQANNVPPDAQRPEHQATQPTAPPGYPPHLPPPIPGQPYPSYVWLPAPPGYMPVPSLAAQPAGMGMQPPPPPSQPAMNISRPASQASHQSHASYDQRGQHSPPQQPPAPQQHPQGNPYGSHPPPPNAFHQPHVNAGPMVLPSGPQNPMDSRHSGPGPMNNPPFNHHSGIPAQPPPGGNGSWNNQYPPPNQGGPNNNNNMMASRSNAAGRGALPPPAGPGRPQNAVDASRSAPNAGTPNVPGNGKRGIPRNAWGAYSYGPGIGIGGMHTTNVPPSGPPLPTGPIGPAGGVLRAPDGLNIRILPPITLESHSTGSSNGSSSSLRKRNVNAAVGVIKSPGDETSSVTSSTSSSSKRTFTSTTSSQPQHHPLPERPDWVLGNRPQPGGASHSRPRGTPSLSTNTRQLLQPSPAGLFNQSTTPSPVNGPSTIPSSSSSISGSDSMSKEFPPLNPGGTSSQGQTSRSRTPASPAGVWNNALIGSTVRPGSAGVSSSPSRPGSTNVPSTLVPSEGRLEEPDNKKFERPPPKTGVSLFNPRVPGSSRSKSSDRSPAQNGSSSVDNLSQTLEATTIADTTVRIDGDGRTDEASSGSGTSYAGTTDISSVDGTGRRTSVEI